MLQTNERRHLSWLDQSTRSVSVSLCLAQISHDFDLRRRQAPAERREADRGSATGHEQFLNAAFPLRSALP